jgi:hypothetical protein
VIINAHSSSFLFVVQKLGPLIGEHVCAVLEVGLDMAGYHPTSLFECSFHVDGHPVIWKFA